MAHHGLRTSRSTLASQRCSVSSAGPAAPQPSRCSGAGSSSALIRSPSSAERPAAPVSTAPWRCVAMRWYSSVSETVSASSVGSIHGTCGGMAAG
eukprot:scaffold279_cov116-Isochrysis_galbana.AAC.7